MTRCPHLPCPLPLVGGAEWMERGCRAPMPWRAARTSPGSQTPPFCQYRRTAARARIPDGADSIQIFPELTEGGGDSPPPFPSIARRMRPPGDIAHGFGHDHEHEHNHTNTPSMHYPPGVGFWRAHPTRDGHRCRRWADTHSETERAASAHPRDQDGIAAGRPSATRARQPDLHRPAPSATATPDTPMPRS